MITQSSCRDSPGALVMAVVVAGSGEDTLAISTKSFPHGFCAAWHLVFILRCCSIVKYQVVSFQEFMVWVRSDDGPA